MPPMPTADVPLGTLLLDALLRCRLAAGRGEARRLLDQGGVRLIWFGPHPAGADRQERHEEAVTRHRRLEARHVGAAIAGSWDDGPTAYLTVGRRGRAARLAITLS